MASEKPDNNLPDGAPPWVTPSLVAETIEFVRKSTGEELTADEAVEFAVSFSQIGDLLKPQPIEQE